MKKILQTLTRVFFAVLLLSFGTANAQTVHFDDAGDPNKATSITGLTVNDISYDVTFIVGQEAFHIYGDYPGTFTFTTSDDAEAAVVAMDAALNAANAAEVGINEISGVESFYVPWTRHLSQQYQFLYKFLRSHLTEKFLPRKLPTSKSAEQLFYI